ncbi:MAG: hypothetical protein ACR2FK_02245, partial [Sphingomicrobium sp.]
DGLDACVYAGAKVPADKAPPPSKAPKELPGSEYETATPPPPEPSVDETPVNTVIDQPMAVEPEAIDEPATEAPLPAEEPPGLENAG